MRYYRLSDTGGSRLVVDDGSDIADLTSADPSVTSFIDVCRAANSDRSIDDVARKLRSEATTIDRDQLAEAIQPAIPQEVWAAGVTYKISEAAREAESGMPEVYVDVYEGNRPELFFKATPSRTVGPQQSVGIRGDSTWDVPEPELAVVLYGTEIVGYTIGNDVSSRSIEGENPLYLPQAKVYDRCCAIGPCVASTETITDPHDLSMSMQIERDGKTLFDEQTETSEMVRSCEELVSYYTRHNQVPELSILLTGTSLVPEDAFTLNEGDGVSIEIEDIGALHNDVITV